MNPLPLKEREYRLSLLRAERRAIIPVKWFILAVTAGLWLTLIDRNPPAAILGLFAAYAFLNAAETWWLYVRRVGLDHVRPITLVSYLADVVYVTVLIYFNLAEQPYSDFYILYFLLVMRGFALFTTFIETLLVNTLISVLFILMLYLQQLSLAFIAEPDFVVRIVLIWLVLLMAWFIMVVMNQQKMDLIRAHDRLGRAENLARLGELAAGVAHEINNPLGIIIANVEFLKRGAAEGTPMREDLDAILNETHRCKEIIRQLLAYANPRPSGLAMLQLAPLLEEVLQFMFPRSRAADVEIVRDIQADVPPVLADPNLLKQALLNLLVNARQAIPAEARGRIAVRLASSWYPPSVVLEIEDNGTGIAPEDLPHVFDPFFTRKPSGTGLGLPTTQRIIESFRGSIFIFPVQPKGTRVRIILPSAIKRGARSDPDEDDPDTE